MRGYVVLLAALLSAPLVFAQDPATGFPAYGSFADGGFDAVNRQNLNVNFAIPIVSSPARGGNFAFSIVYDSLIWKKAGTTTSWTPVTEKTGEPTWGWKKEFPVGSISYVRGTKTCKDYSGIPPVTVTETFYRGYAYTDTRGTRHGFDVVISGDFCTPATAPTGYAKDGSGYYLDANTPDAPIVFDSAGQEVTSVGSWIDTNGNFVSNSVSGAVSTWKDTLGRNALIVDKTASTYIDYKYLDTSGAYQTTRLTLGSFDIKTNFGCSGVVEYTGTASLPTQISLPNGKAYTFTYEPTPGQSGYYTGRVLRATLPTGGYYEYQYPTTGNNGINCADGTAVNLTKNMNDTASTATWTFARTQIGVSNWKTVVTAPQLPYDAASNVSTFTFANDQETSRKIYQGSEAPANLLRTINTAWGTNGTPASKTVVLEDGTTQSKVETDFDSNGNLLAVREYDWGSGGPAANPTRTTALTYLSGTAYTSRNIINRLTQKIVRDGGPTGTIKYRLDVVYDEASYSNVPCITGAVQHDDTNYGCGFTTRGNPSSVTSYADAATPAGGVTKHFTYDSLGNLRQADVNCCQQKQWNYSTTTNYAFPDSVVSGPAGGTQLTTSASYNAYTGQASTSTDENGKQTTFTYDLATLRVKDIQRPDSTHITYDYDDTGRTVTVSTPIQGTDVAKQIMAYDGLGRTILSKVLDASLASYSIVETQYDPVGRPYKTSNPHNSTAQYWTETRFDGLGRPVKVIPPDGTAASNNTSYAYGGNSVTVTDPAGKQRKSQMDALGRLVKVTEPDPGGALTVDTTYTYTVLDVLTQVSEGVQTRTYNYDGLVRLTSAATPEAGTVNYQYNAFDLVTQRTDARGVITTYSYDTLNRLTGISYNVGSTGVPATPAVTFGYDAGGAAANALGRLTSMTDGVGSETYTYEPNLPLVTQVQKVISGTTYALGYAYNLAGEVKQIAYPSGRKVQPSYDAIGRLSTVADTMGTVNTTYASGFSYNPAFQVLGFNYGNGVAASFGYSPDRLQLTSLSYAKGASTLFSLNYWYKTDATNCANAPGGNNGQIQCVTDNVDAGRSVKYAYDPLARLASAVTAGSAGYPQWGLSWTYDRYGNRTAQSVTAGSGPSNAVNVSATTNRITDPGYSYDANGNMTNDGLNALAYDGENRAVSAAGATYSYDGNGLRVKKVAGATTTGYIFSGSKVVAEYENGAASGSPTREYIYSGGMLLAKIEGGATAYYHADHLSARVTTDTNGSKLGEQGHYPFGESWYAASSTTKWQFTSYERDAESGNDYAMFRYHVNRLGRFSSPDLLAGLVADPQSLNRYAYVRNDPTNLVDPLGLVMTWWGWGGGGYCFSAACSSSGFEFREYYIDGIRVSAGTAERFLHAGLVSILPTERTASTSVRDGTVYQLQLVATVFSYLCDITGGTCFGKSSEALYLGWVPVGQVIWTEIVDSLYGATDPGWERTRATLGAVHRMTDRPVKALFVGTLAIPIAVVGGELVLGGALGDAALAFEAAHPGATVATMQFAQTAFTNRPVPATAAGYAGFVVRMLRQYFGSH